MKHHHSEDGHLVNIDEDSPLRLLARREPLHPDDPDDFDADFRPDDNGERIDFEGIKAVPRDALKTLLRFLVPSNSVSEKKKWRMAQLRVALLSHMLNVDGLGALSFEELGKELECTRSLLSLYSLRIVDGLTLNKAPNGKQRSAREIYRQTATAAHRRAGHRMASDESKEAL
jgi:hypothetical protein